MELATVKAIVTGGASGLGRATAARVIAGGGRVAIFDLARSAGADVARDLGDRAAFVSTDVTSGDAVASAVEQARAQFGGVNVLVNCAGIGTAARTVGRSGPAKLDEFTRVIQVNLIGTFNCIRLAVGAGRVLRPGAGAGAA